MALRLALVLLAAWGGVAAAQTPDAGPAETPDAPPAATLIPPEALVETTVPYPEGAPPHEEPIAVRVKILVGADGTVQKVDLTDPGIAIFDDAVVAAARAWSFEPGRYEGKPVPVEILFTHTFLPPAPPEPPPDEGPPLTAVLRGRLVEMGTRAPVGSATVTARLGERHYSADSDATGRFRLPVPAGPARVSVHAPGYNAFVQQEKLEASQELAVTYYVRRERYDPYEIVVFGEQRREEVSRVTLRGAEIKQIPGTFGDPFRVIQTLPGVSSVMSLLPFPIVRGASPSSTGFLLDGTRVPLLYHLLSGPSVIHPEFIDEVEFYGGGAPVTYGGYTGGIVDGRTRRARAGEKLWDLDANLLEAGGLVRQPIGFLDATLTAAGRYGYPGLALSLATNEVSLSYWDYQLRLDGGNARNGWTLFAFGARDVLETLAEGASASDPDPPLEPSLILGFHRLDLRAHHGRGALDAAYRLVLGYDETLGQGSNVSTFVVEPQVRLRWRAADALTFAAGLEGQVHDLAQGTPPQMVDDDLDLGEIVGGIERLFTGATFVEALWRPTPRLLLRPGVRATVLDDGETTRGAIEPRLTGRFRLAERELPGVAAGSDDAAIWLKGGLGVFHQPPRFILPLPGLDTMPLRYGLLRSIQSSAGAEVPFRDGLRVEVEGYFSLLDPTVFDLSVNPNEVNNVVGTSLFPTSNVAPQTSEQEVIDRLLSPKMGRAFGLEVLVRRESRRGFFGWISYTLSRAERERDGQWVAYDFDRTHLLNVVAGLRLPRNWDLGVRLQYQSGKPATTTAGYNSARIGGYTRIDVRIDKRVVLMSWLLDFYVDIANVALLPEEVAPGDETRYVLPTIGVRGRF